MLVFVVIVVGKAVIVAGKTVVIVVGKTVVVCSETHVASDLLDFKWRLFLHEIVSSIFWL